MDAHAAQSASPYPNPDLLPPRPSSTSKRSRVHTDFDEPGHGSKRIKSAPEEPALYSENVRKKLAATSRTGQACDRCKERKMKCDPDPIACQPCRSKSLRCYTTDRVSGQSRERGQTDRAEGEMNYLRDRLSQYERRYGPLSGDMPPTPYTAFASPSRERCSTYAISRVDVDTKPGHCADIPSSQYIGWPTPDNSGSIHKGPVEGTKADILDWGIMDSGDFDCDIMCEASQPTKDHFNFSTGSVLRTIHQRQKIPEHHLQLPPKKDALEQADIFLNFMWGFVPVVHKGSFISLIHRLYDIPHTVSLAEKVQVVQMLAIINHQTAIRNHSQASKIQDSYRYMHYALGFYPSLIQDTSLAAMQALSMILVHFRNMPKPGHTWTLAQEMLTRCIDQDYHRDPDKIDLPAEEQSVLPKELRKRVFHVILGICVSTGCRLGRPAPWQFVHWDVPLPLPIKDSELSQDGLQPQRSGQCDFWECIHLAKLLPLYTELHNYVLTVRRSAGDYVKTVAALKTKIDAWRADWDACTQHEDKTKPQIVVAGLLIDTWAAEFLLNLHHPSVCTARTPDILDKNLDICHKASKRLLSNFHTLSKRYKAVDFSWHSTVAYTLGFGLTLHIFRRQTNQITQEQFNAMKNELAGWMSLMAYADLVLRTENRLQRHFRPLVELVQQHIQVLIVNGSHTDRHSALPLITRSHHEASRSGTAIKQESGSNMMADTRRIQEQSTTPNGHGPLQSRSSQRPYSADPHQSSLPGLPPKSYDIYSPSGMQYPNLPTSLAPLLNDPPSSMSPYPARSLQMQDPAMMFSPHLYTDATAEWPLIPNGAPYS
ncbi:hypothetical protein PMZ80_002982 [Knufia obscura]|uniref:Zn(2)-C6 fungal-type domain-containing protein n=1 Tax=Knufia obscura TaxID=1635080 RepID=A0ABR0S0A9_9EURO|nr:hypothetical protein PMZ80_002982 [Knufia obscura]